MVKEDPFRANYIILNVMISMSFLCAYNCIVLKLIIEYTRVIKSL